MSYSRVNGFTLIELLLYVTILSSLLLSVVLFFSMTNEAQVKSATISTVNEQSIFAMDYMTTAIRGASTISAPAAAATASSLSVTVPTSANSPTVFALSGGALTVKEGTATAVTLTSPSVTVSNLSFKNLTRSGTNGIVQISFTMASSNTTGRQEYDYSNVYTSSAEVSW